MRLRFLMVVVTVLALAGTGSAQGVDIFGGYSFLNADAGTSRETANGFLANASVFFNSNLGVVGEVGGQFDDLGDFTEVMGGLAVRSTEGALHPFAHAKLGVVRISDAGFSDSNFGLGFGGGLDINTGSPISIRVVQFDWLPTKIDSSGMGSSEWETSAIRLAFGVTFTIE